LPAFHTTKNVVEGSVSSLPAACLHVRRAMQAAWRHASCAERAGGPADRSRAAPGSTSS